MKKFIIRTQWEGKTAHLVEGSSKEEAEEEFQEQSEYKDLFEISKYDNEEVYDIQEVKADEDYGDTWLKLKQRP